MSPCLGTTETELTENDNFCLFSADGKQNGKLPFVCCERKREKWKFVFLGQQTMNGSRRLLFQQM
jgi:hypothetical protein